MKLLFIHQDWGVCAVSCRKIAGPIYLKDTITLEHYIDIVQEFLGHLTEEEISVAWSQEDSTTCYTATKSKLSLLFENWIISKGLWPPSSLHLSPPDIFLWGYIKDNTYAIWIN
jgi:hypothetical protein